MQTGSEFSPSLDAFHLPFPASAEEYISCRFLVDDIVPRNIRPRGQEELVTDRATGGPQSERDGQKHGNGPMPSLAAGPEPRNDGRHHGGDSIFRLPAEITDLVLSYLSPAALDAARYTCKAWHQHITSNSWVLSSVLDKSGETDLRGLLKGLDRGSDLLSTHQHPDAWRTRFRMRSLTFSIPEKIRLRGTSVPTCRFGQLAATVRVGSQGGFMIFQFVTSGHVPSPPGQKSVLMIYTFSPTDVPLFVGCVEHLGFEDPIKVIGMTRIKPNTKSKLKIEIGGIVTVYKISPRKAFSKLENRFSIKDLGSSHRSQTRYSENFIEIAQDLKRPLGVHIIDGQSWKVLAFLPPDLGVSLSLGFSRKHK